MIFYADHRKQSQHYFDPVIFTYKPPSILKCQYHVCDFYKLILSTTHDITNQTLGHNKMSRVCTWASPPTFYILNVHTLYEVQRSMCLMCDIELLLTMINTWINYNWLKCNKSLRHIATDMLGWFPSSPLPSPHPNSLFRLMLFYVAVIKHCYSIC